MEGFESLLLVRAPVKSDILLGEIVERSGNLGKLVYEPSIEVCKS